MLLIDLFIFFPPLTVEGIMGVEVTDAYPVIDVSLSSLSTKPPVDPTMIFFSMDYGKFCQLLSLKDLLYHPYMSNFKSGNPQ